MELQITGRNIELTEMVRNRVQRKISRLSRHFDSMSSAKVEISREMTKSPEERYVVQVTIDSRGVLLRGEERAADLYSAISNVAKMMDRQFKRYKSRLYEKGRGTSPLRSQSPVSPRAESSKKVVKVKKFEVKPMSPEEAIEQMELLGHDFFVFFDAMSEEINVLYRRRDGNYGLIQPTPD